MGQSSDRKDSLRTIAYFSDMARVFSSAEIGALADQSASWNGRFGVTGVLFTIRRQFLQVIEGKPQTIGLIFRKIAADARHHDVTRILDDTVEGRAFPDWAMRHIDLSAAEERLVLDALAPPVRADRAASKVTGLRPSEFGAMLAEDIDLSHKPRDARKTIEHLLYALETIWASRVA